MFETLPLNMRTRHIVVKLILDDGEFPSNANNDSTQPRNVKIIRANSDMNSLTVSCNINKQSGFMQCTCDLVIYGMTIDDCNAFARYNPPTQLALLKNHIEVYAGYDVDENGFPPLAYAGQVFKAYPNFNDSSRSRPLVINSMMGIVDQNTIATTTNPKGTIALNDLFSSMVSKAPKAPQKYVYKGRNINGIVQNAVYSGSWLDQLRQCANDHGYQAKLDGYNVMVSPIGQNYIDDIYILESDNGMLGYPALAEYGIDVRMRYDPNVQFGQKITVQNSAFTLANKTWFINGIITTLESRGRRWESMLKLNDIQFVVPVSGG